ncbi:hypothetical protein [Mycolicibacterium septicum]|uniref:hypothetical protein n=1 Tax=Mycolicibacterium septicum TaxID=98668 RepID=UPI001AF954E4|nr:hypothetical protein [Mycolicibacterium septicum]QRY51722.1 hypothetical protein JVX95_30830 [Mycolicibacterium septicum]
MKYLVTLIVGAVLDYFKNNPEFREELLDSLSEKLTAKFPDFSKIPGEIIDGIGERFDVVTERLVPDVNSLASKIAEKIPGLEGVTSLLARFGIR